MATLKKIEEEKRRRQRSASPVSGFDEEEIMRPRQKNIMEQFFQRPAEQNPGKLSSILTGANTSVERIVQGLLQPALGRTQGFKNTAQRREQEYSASEKVNPGATLTGEIIGDIGIGAPFGAGGAKLATKLPKISAYAAKNPYLKNIIGGLIGGGGFGAAQHVTDEESRAMNGALGAGLGAGLGVISPAISATASGIGKGVKAGINSIKKSYQSIQRSRGSEEHIIKELLENYTPQEITKALENHGKAKRIGVKLTPAEASGNKIGAKFEGKLGISPEGERKLYEHKKNQKLSEEDAISDLLKTINKSTESGNERVRSAAQSAIRKKELALQERARPYYKAAESQKIEPAKLQELTNNGIIEKELKSIIKDPKYRTEVEGHDINSIKVLDAVKKKIDGLMEAAKRSGNNNDARLYKNAKDSLVEAMDKVSVDYKKARSIYAEDSPTIDLLRKREVGKIAKLNDIQLKQASKVIFDPAQTDSKVLNKLRDEISKEDPDAWSRIVRSAMENKISTTYSGTTGYHGTNFYRQILANERTFNQFYSSLKGNHEARERLQFMKSIFKDLINEPTVKGAAAQSKTSMTSSRSSTQAVKRFISNVTGGKYDKAAIDIITTDKWQKAFRDAQSAVSPQGKALAMEKLLNSVNKRHGKSAINSAVIGKSTSTNGEKR
jgi:hypothetical protein